MSGESAVLLSYSADDHESCLLVAYDQAARENHPAAPLLPMAEQDDDVRLRLKGSKLLAKGGWAMRGAGR